MSDMKANRKRTNDEIEALLRSRAPDELRNTERAIARRVVTRLRSDPELRARGSAMRIGLDDEGRVPRWFVAAAAIGITALAGWVLLTPGGANRDGEAALEGPITERTPSLPHPDLFDVPAGKFLHLAIEPQAEEVRREARALLGAGWELAGRVIGGIPVELVRPIADQERGDG